MSGQINVLREVTGRHGGYEVRAAAAVSVPLSKGALSASTGFTWKSSAVVNYYYGVQGLYEPGSALNPFVKFGYTLPLTDRWTLQTFTHYEFLGNAIALSPIVAEHRVLTAFFGVAYRMR
jgi:outer membrane protein